MDNYTKMCNCPEIQGGWEPKVGDWTDKGVVWNFELDDAELGYRKPYGAYILEYDDPWARCSGEFYKLKELIYLPSIRQLMGMLPKDGDYKLQWNDGFDFMYPAGQGYYHYLHARCPKEALLGGVMHELHGKKWSGEKWVGIY